MALRPPRHQYSYDEYLAYERDSRMKHEYDNGKIAYLAAGVLGARIARQLAA